MNYLFDKTFILNQNDDYTGEKEDPLTDNEDDDASEEGVFEEEEETEEKEETY